MPNPPSHNGYNEFDDTKSAGYARIRLNNSAERLCKLLKVNAPDVILANEICMLFRCAMGCLGPVLWRAFGSGLNRLWRLGNGLCEYCDKETDSESICLDCETKLNREADEENARMDAEEYPDDFSDDD